MGNFFEKAEPALREASGSIRDLAGNVKSAQEVKVFCFFFSKKKSFFL